MVSIYKDKKTGKYYFSASLGFDSVTGKRIRKVKRGFATEKEARLAYYEFMNDHGKSAYKTNTTMSYGEYLETIFIPWYRGRVKERTFENRESSIRTQFTYFHKMKVSEITPIYIQKWQNELLKKYSNSYARNVYGMFSMSLERAYRLGMIMKNPAKIVGNISKEKKEVEYWTKKEFEKVISTFNMQDYYEMFSFISVWLYFMTGMRFGEGQALKWTSDVDFETRTLRVSKTMYYKNAENYELVEPKTRASNRIIPIDDDTLDYLKKWRDMQDENFSSEFVLSYNGIPTNKHTIRHIIKRHAKIANVHDIRIHALRHSHASLLISMGESALIIKDRLGHEDIQTTLGTYGHLYPNSNFEVASKLTGLIEVNENKKIPNKLHEFNGNQYIKKEGKKNGRI